MWLLWERLPASISRQDAAPTKKQNRNAMRLAGNVQIKLKKSSPESFGDEAIKAGGWRA
jgi:hypothetical protein